MKKPQVFLTCGSGGVGKTTVSAALCLKKALEGKKSIVLTIDPAKRLATSLGLEHLNDVPKQIKLPKNSKGQMWAMMLDTKRTFDRLIERYASSEDNKNKILNNKLYQHMSQMLSGTQEYMAMERLYEVYQKNEYDVIVVDTPPMQNAKDFLAAPQKMMNMINNSILNLLLKPTLSIGKSGFKLLGQGSEQIVKILDGITGFAFLQDISEMLMAFKDLLAGFESRASTMSEILKEHHAHFLIVCTSSDHSVDEAQSFLKQLKSLQYNADAIVVNRVYQGETLSQTELSTALKKLSKSFSKKEAHILLENYHSYSELMKRDKNQLKLFETSFKRGKIIKIPLFYSDVHDLDSLKDVSLSLEDL